MTGRLFITHQRSASQIAPTVPDRGGHDEWAAQPHFADKPAQQVQHRACTLTSNRQFGLIIKTNEGPSTRLPRDLSRLLHPRKRRGRFVESGRR